jgi:hypothetical protein
MTLDLGESHVHSENEQHIKDAEQVFQLKSKKGYI